jgi:hypothetical protein
MITRRDQAHERPAQTASALLPSHDVLLAYQKAPEANLIAPVELNSPGPTVV